MALFPMSPCRMLIVYLMPCILHEVKDAVTSIHPTVPIYMSPENSHKLMGLHMEDLIVGVIFTLVHGFLSGV